MAAGSAATTAVGDQDGDSRFGLSIIQIPRLSTFAAARRRRKHRGRVTAAVIGSRLGVAGTLTGAALRLGRVRGRRRDLRSFADGGPGAR